MLGAKPHTVTFSVSGRNGGDVFRSALTPYFEQHVLELEPGSKAFTAQIALRRLKKIQIFTGRYQQAFRLQVPNALCFVQGFPSQDAGEYVNNGIARTSSPGCGMLAEPGELKLSYGSGFELDAIWINPDALSQTLAVLIGLPLGRELKLENAQSTSRPDGGISHRLVKILAADLDNEDSLLSHLVIAELEQAILVGFLCRTRHNYSSLLEIPPSDAAPRQIHRVEGYIEANWDQPIAIEALAIVARASARSIFHSFKKYRGYSPMSFVKQVRLRHARDMLRSPVPGATVTRVAFACGFGNLGHFAINYRKTFGETPSATLNGAKGQSSS